MEQANIVAPRKTARGIPDIRQLRNISAYLLNPRLIPYLYLCITLPTVLFLCFLVPPMQSMDESRHFVRACQIAQGGWRSEIDPATGRGGGLLPEAVADFVRHWMNTESLRSEDALHTIRERVSALDRASQTQAPIARKKLTRQKKSWVDSGSGNLPSE